MGVLEAILDYLWGTLGMSLTMFGQNFGHFREGFLDVMGIFYTSAVTFAHF